MATKINELQRQNANKTGEELKVSELARRLKVTNEEIIEAQEKNVNIKDELIKVIV